MGRKPKLPLFTDLIALLDKDLSVKQIAERYHTTVGAVYNKLRRKDIALPPRKKLSLRKRKGRNVAKLPLFTDLIAFLDEDLSVKQIAERYHATTGAVYNLLKRNNVNVRDMHLSRNVAKLPLFTDLIALLDEGLSVKQIAERYHTTTGAVSNLLKRNNVNVRDMHLSRNVAPRKLPQKTKILSLREQGLSLFEIGEIYGTTKQAVHYALKRESKMPISGRFYISKEIQGILEISKQRVSDLAREHGWRSPHPGWYYADGVEEYIWSRFRRQLFKKFGIPAKELVTDDAHDLDDNCPVCGSFAIYRPPTTEEMMDLDQPVYGEGWPWKCIKGHGSEDVEIVESEDKSK